MNYTYSRAAKRSRCKLCHRLQPVGTMTRRVNRKGHVEHSPCSQCNQK